MKGAEAPPINYLVGRLCCLERRQLDIADPLIPDQLAFGFRHVPTDIAAALAQAQQIADLCGDRRAFVVLRSLCFGQQRLVGGLGLRRIGVLRRGGHVIVPFFSCTR